MGYNPLGLYPEGMDYYDSGVSYTGAFLGTLETRTFSAHSSACPAYALSQSALHYGGRDLLLLLPSALCALVAALSKSEAALLGIAAGALIGIPYYVYLHSSRRPALIFLGCEAALLIAGLALVYFAAPASGTLYELHEILHGRISDSFGSSRHRNLARSPASLRRRAADRRRAGYLRPALHARVLALCGRDGHDAHHPGRQRALHAARLSRRLRHTRCFSLCALCIVILRRAAKSGFPALFPALAAISSSHFSDLELVLFCP